MASKKNTEGQEIRKATYYSQAEYWKDGKHYSLFGNERTAEGLKDISEMLTSVERKVEQGLLETAQKSDDAIPDTNEKEDNRDNAGFNQESGINKSKKSAPSSDRFKIIEVTNDGNIIYEDQKTGQCVVSEGEAVLNKLLSLKSGEFTHDPIQYILDDVDISKNGDVNNQKFLDGAIAATLTTLEQGTKEVFAYGVGKQSNWYKYHKMKMGAITGIVDYNINLNEQREICPHCDDTINHIVASVQTVVGSGVTYTGGAAGTFLGPVGVVGGAVAASTVYEVSGINKQVGELARPIASYIVGFYTQNE